MRLLSMIGKQIPRMSVRCDQRKARYVPPTDDPVVTIPSARLRRLRKYCEMTERAGRKIKPVPIPIPTPWASMVCQNSLAKEVMNRLQVSDCTTLVKVRTIYQTI